MMQQVELMPPRKIRPPFAPKALAGRTVTVDIPRDVRARLRTPQKMKVSEWAELKRVVPEGAHEGPWRSELAPHTVKIMDTYGLPWVREVWFCGVEQSGKTNTMINCMGWAVDCDPGNIFYLMPTESSSNQIVGQKIKPTFQRSPALSKYLSARQDDTTMARIALRHGVTIFPAHANSPTSMATFAAKHCFGDEVDKYPAMAGRETDPITLLKKRNRNYRGRFKRFFSSTPAGAYIYKGMQACHQVWDFRVKCPECCDYIHMDVDHLVLDENATADNVDRIGVQYACNGCGALWDDHDRESSIRNGRWQCVKGDDIARPAKVGFHHRAWECMDIPLVEIAAAWLKTKSGEVSAKIAWANGYEAEDYKQDNAVHAADTILRLCDDRPRDLVPQDTACLLMQVDTQQLGFYYEIRAALFGASTTSAQIRSGYVEKFTDLVEIAALDFHDVSGKAYRVMSALIDSGGTRKAGAKHSRTSEVYAFCKANPIFKAIKGADRASSPWRVTNIDRWPGTNKAIPGGLHLYTINVNYYKDALSGKLQISPDDPGAWLLYSGHTAEELMRIDAGEQLPNRLKEYATHFCTEYRDETGQWLHDRSKGRNDYWDVGVYFIFHCDLLRVAEWQPEDQDEQPKRKVYSRGIRRD